MRKCNRFLDSIEKESMDENSGAWQDLILHAGRCPDCSTDLKARGQLLESLSAFPEPDYPAGLNDLIMERIKRASSDEELVEGPDSGLIARFLEISLRPLEFAIPLACAVMFIFLINVNDHHEEEKTVNRVILARQKTSSHRSVDKPVTGKLEKVDVAEVNEFLRQLEEFRRLHPESMEQKQTLAPAVELVNDRRYWRNR